MAPSLARSSLSPGPHDRPSPSAAPAPATTHPSPSPSATPAPATTHHSHDPSPSSFSPDAPPFHPSGTSGGRGKLLRWQEDFPGSDDEADLGSRRPSYRDALLQPAAQLTSEAKTQGGAPPPAAAPTGGAPSTKNPTQDAKKIHDRPDRRDEARSGRHRQRRRGQTRLIHGLPIRRPDAAGTHRNGRAETTGAPRSGRLRSTVVVPPRREPFPPLVDADGFTRVQSRRERNARRRRQRQRQHKLRQAPPSRITTELAGQCLNCLSFKHLVAQCHLPTRCFRCRGFWHLARDCKRPRSPASSGTSADGGGRQILRPRRDSPLTPRGRQAHGRTPSPRGRQAHPDDSRRRSPLRRPDGRRHRSPRRDLRARGRSPSPPRARRPFLESRGGGRSAAPPDARGASHRGGSPPTPTGSVAFGRTPSPPPRPRRQHSPGRRHQEVRGRSPWCGARQDDAAGGNAAPGKLPAYSSEHRERGCGRSDPGPSRRFDLPQGPSNDTSTPRHPTSPPNEDIDMNDCFFSDDELPPGHPSSRPAHEVCYISRTPEMDAEEARLRFALLANAPSGYPTLSVESMRRAVADIAGIGDEHFSVRRFAPEDFLVVFGSQRARDHALDASFVHVDGVRISFRPWTRLVGAAVEKLRYRVSLEIEGIPAHAWGWRTARKILASSCWIERIEPASEDRSDMSFLALTAWTNKPSSIPREKTVFIAEHVQPVVYSDPDMQRIFASVRPYLREKGVLRYETVVHLRTSTRTRRRRPPALPRPPMMGTPATTGTPTGATANPGGTAARGSSASTWPAACQTGMLPPLPAEEAPPRGGNEGRRTRCPRKHRRHNADDEASQAGPSELVSFADQQPTRLVEGPPAWDPMLFESQTQQPRMITQEEDDNRQPASKALKTYRRRGRTAPARSDCQPGVEPAGETPAEPQRLPTTSGKRAAVAEDEDWTVQTPTDVGPAQPEQAADNNREASRARQKRPKQTVEPTLEEAKAATAAFLASVSQALQVPLASLPERPAGTTVPTLTPVPRRSGRLAVQALNSNVRPSKKGEVLVMRKLGLCTADGPSAGQKFGTMFHDTPDPNTFAAIRDIFPTARALTDADLMAAARQVNSAIGVC
ncbi:unnamed protein product [Urochloa decumbens]|uniref:CCHC-type domain-containing protein n=1 Tax=Urochloa decumbens TaxID=240449 RepID=A0ABC8YLL1_9POAL